MPKGSQLQQQRQQKEQLHQNRQDQMNRNQQDHQIPQIPQQEVQQTDYRTQFWTEEVVLTETIPKEGEDLSAEMERAYNQVTEDRASKKARTFRTERTTKKKRERTNAIINAEARYAHNRDLMQRKSGLREKLGSMSGYYKDQVEKWLNLSGTPEADAYNERLVNGFSGNSMEEHRAIKGILDDVDSWDLNDYASLDDETISKNYYALRDKIEKADAASSLLYKMLQDGTSDLTVEYVARLRAKFTFFSQLSTQVDAKVKLMKSPYYALMRKRDIDNLGIEAVRAKYDWMSSSASGYKQDHVLMDYYSALLNLDRVRKQRESLNDPEAFIHAQQEALQQKAQTDVLVSGNKLIEKRSQVIIPCHDKALEVKQSYLDQQNQADREAGLEVLRGEKPQLRSSLRCWLDRSGTPEAAAANQALVQKFAGNDRSAELEEISRMMREVDGFSLPSLQTLDDKSIADHYSLIMEQTDKALNVLPLLKYFLSNGGSCDDELRKRLVVKEKYYEKVRQYVNFRIVCMRHPSYLDEIQNSTDALTNEELLQKSRTETNEEKRAYYSSLYNQRSNGALDDLRDPDASMQKALKSENVLGGREEERMPFLIDKVIVQLKENEAKCEPARAEKLKHRRELYVTAFRIGQEVLGERECRWQLCETALGDAGLQRYVKAFVLDPSLTDEQVIERAKNLTSKDKEVRYAEYNRIFDDMLNLDLSQFNNLDTDEGLLSQGKKLSMYGNIWMEINNLLSEAINDGMEIPQERQQAIWNRYEFLIGLSNTLMKRIHTINTQGYAEITKEEEPKSILEVMEQMQKGKKDTYITGMLSLHQAYMENSFDLSKPLEPQWKNFKGTVYGK